MNLLELKNKQVAILGFGEKEGKATLEYLLKHEIRPTLFDQRVWEDFDLETQNHIKEKNVPFVFGPGYLDELRSFEIAFRNPAVPFYLPGLQNLIKRGLIVTSQTKWFFEHCPAKIIGVTGTKGKGTTATLIAEILRLKFQISNSKYQAYLTGNIGKIQSFEFLDNLNPEDLVVYELSSFQLQDLDISPNIGVVLMTTSEHLDYHKNLNEYWDAKSNITKYQTAKDICVFNTDYEGSKYIGKLGNGKKLSFSTKLEIPNCFIKDGFVTVDSKNIINLSKVQLRGKHNWQNICAATLVASTLGIEDSIIAKVVENFQGLEHRLEFVAEKNKIKFYNDSFSTTPETAIAAIESFTEPLILILGGSNKNSDFTELGQVIKSTKNIKTIILIGSEAEKIRQYLPEYLSLKQGAGSMLKIFDQIKEIANSGDTVLLSPACASFDMFKNYMDRGEQFKKLVNFF